MRCLCVNRLGMTACAVPLVAFGVLAVTQYEKGEAASQSTASLAAASNPGPWINSTAHVYREGDQLSAAYGEFSDVQDWSMRHLTEPPADHRWVRYGETYLLVDGNAGVIRAVVAASWDAGRA